MSARPIHAAQFRLTGPTEGTRVLRQVTGPQRWRLHIWLTHADGMRDERDILVSQPCYLHQLHAVYDREIDEMCEGIPTVREGGWDAYLLAKAPPRPQPHTHTTGRPAAA